MNRTTTRKGAAGKYVALLASLTMMGAGLVGVAFAAPASAVDATGYDATAYPGLNVCPQNTDGWSSHQSADGQESWTLEAPVDTLITEICVKSGSENSGDGPVKVLFVGPADEVTFAYPGGKEISHFSYRTTLKPTTSLTVTKAWQATGTGAALTAATTVANSLNTANTPAIHAGTLGVSVGGSPLNPAPAWGATTPNLTIGATAVVSEGQVPPLTGPFPEGFTCSLAAGFPTFSQNTFALASTPNTVIVNNGVACTANITPPPPPPPPPPNNPPADTPVVPAPVVAPPVVEAAQVAVPIVALPATVPAAPVKKPVVVNAPKPAKVEGGVAGTVSVPAAATVPAAVPAGDGSQAPGLPMWALALVAVGALGAAAAGKQMLGARK